MLRTPSGIYLMPARLREDTEGFEFFVAQSNCFGGYAAEMPLEQMLPYREIATATKETKYYRLFRDITAAELTAGVTLYRCIFLKWSGEDATDEDLSNLSIGITQPTSGVVVSLWMDTNYPTVEITGETVAPVGAVWTTPTEAVPQLLAVAPGYGDDPIPIWLRYVVSAGAAQKAYDRFKLHITSSGHDAEDWNIYNHRRAGVIFASVVSDRQGLISRTADIVRFTLSTTNSAGTATDPAGSKVLVHVVKDLSSSQHQQAQFDTGIIESAHRTLEAAKRTGTGAYQYDLHPTGVGLYKLTFDIGEDSEVYEQWINP